MSRHSARRHLAHLVMLNDKEKSKLQRVDEESSIKSLSEALPRPSRGSSSVSQIPQIVNRDQNRHIKRAFTFKLPKTTGFQQVERINQSHDHKFDSKQLLRASIEQNKGKLRSPWYAVGECLCDADEHSNSCIVEENQVPSEEPHLNMIESAHEYLEHNLVFIEQPPPLNMSKQRKIDHFDVKRLGQQNNNRIMRSNGKSSHSVA